MSALGNLNRFFRSLFNRNLEYIKPAVSSLRIRSLFLGLLNSTTIFQLLPLLISYARRITSKNILFTWDRRVVLILTIARSAKCLG